jgi:hypothetical protein
MEAKTMGYFFSVLKNPPETQLYLIGIRSNRSTVQAVQNVKTSEA